MVPSSSCGGQESFIFQSRYGPGLATVLGTALFKATAHLLLVTPRGPVDSSPAASARPSVSANARIVDYKDLDLSFSDLGRARLMRVMATAARRRLRQPRSLGSAICLLQLTKGIRISSSRLVSIASFSTPCYGFPQGVHPP
jgi:hypothetical protein